MVVSEMGEQWSPQTAPARHADTEITSIGSVGAYISTTMGINMPNVPHDVPVAKLSRQPIIKMIAGRNIWNFCTAFDYTRHIFRAAKHTGHCGKSPCKREDKYCGDHRLKPCGDSFHALLKVKHSAAQQVYYGE